MKPKRKKEIKEMFGRYVKAGKEKKECEEPCLKNGKSDRYCLECANEIMGDLIKP